MRLALLALLLSSCAHLGNSGYYVRRHRGENFKRLAQRFDVPEWQVQAANPKGLEDLMFIPLNRGILPNLKGETESSARIKSLALAWPVPSNKRISSRFGRRWGRPHQGIDIPAREGATIVAAENGVVIYSGKALGGYGNLTVIAHRGGVFTVYAHSKRNYTREGQQVVRGQAIAQVGSTGRSSGPHLHFEVRYNSRALNPEPWLVRR